LRRVRGASSIRYWSGSTTSALTSALTSSASYTQPFGSNGQVDSEPFCDDVGDFLAVIVGRRNRSGIFVVFEGVEDVSCQRCGLHTIEVKPHHASARTDRCTGTRGWEGGRSRDGLGMTGVCPWQYWFCSPHRAHCRRSEVVAEPLESARCCHSSQSRLRSSSCSRFQAKACLIPSPFGRGE
jgi:hypothetical protein